MIWLITELEMVDRRLIGSPTQRVQCVLHSKQTSSSLQAKSICFIMWLRHIKISFITSQHIMLIQWMQILHLQGRRFMTGRGIGKCIISISPELCLNMHLSYTKPDLNKQQLKLNIFVYSFIFFPLWVIF